MFNPISTYRIQFHKDFTFTDFEKTIPYLQQLGVKTLYASPIFEATPGSVHGYDVVNPLTINPEIGTEESLRSLHLQLKEAGICWLQDIVPNHMAYHSNNLWLMDVLEKGEQSVYAPFFDITWTSKLFKGKVMVPFLGKKLEEIIQNRELKVDYEDGRFVLKYYNSYYPLKIHSYLTILHEAKENDAIKVLNEQINNSHKIEDSQELKKSWDELLFQLQALMKNDIVKSSIQLAIDTINEDIQKIKQLADEQHYRLCHWQETDYQINFRRFFTVNGLICLNIQDPKVLDEHHALIKKLINEGVFQGLRVDHIDGLYDPAEYLERLRNIGGEESYLVVEKILEPGEDMPHKWPIQGNTGYDFLAMANNLFTNKKAEEAFTQYYQELTGEYSSIHQQIHEKKAYILNEHMGGELENLYQLFLQLNITDKKQLARIPPDDLKSVIGEFLIQCPVYRYYGNRFPLQEEEETALRNLFYRLRKSGESLEAVSILESSLLQKPYEGNEDLNERIRQFYQRCMQFTGPLMAKGVEDTVMYTYNRFIGHNEVGDSPEAFGDSAEVFHQKMISRQQNWPLSINATSSHDTKRGEDARARLNVLTDLHNDWLSKVEEWRSLTKDLKQNNFPDANDEYFIYQALVGGYPMPGQGDDQFADRIQEYLQKALREAKRHSNWTTPNEEYESATKSFALSLLDKDKPFWKSFVQLHEEIADHGIINSLAQVVLKFTCPGVPDVYQGCEFWDFSLVDPDNRRPVNFEKRMQVLEELQNKTGEDLFSTLWNNRHNAAIKLWTIHEMMELRKLHPDVFTEGEYIPLNTEGTYKEHVLAFARRNKGVVYVVALPLHTALLSREQGKDFLDIDWKDTQIHLPKEIKGEIEQLFTGTKFNKGVRVQAIFQNFPIAILRGRQSVNERSAGILAHISSLPSPFGIGDLGPAAKAFADFLYRSGQRYWQLLPLNPTEAGQGYSPYSALSSKAGYPLLISPELLVKYGLLDAETIRRYHLPQENKVDYPEAERVKTEIVEKAFTAFLQFKSSPLHEEFKQYQKMEKEWLDDFALFMQLKKQHEGKPWFEWPDEYKLRNAEALKKFADSNKKELKKIKWFQFIFAKQWHELRNYCNGRNINLIGDIPFYISYDSSDVWSHREIFAVDQDGRQTGIAGVPPDSFSVDGQLWGMPVFKWDKLKETAYQWWVSRLRKNIELFDIVRLDHFRAFEAYWEVPAGETTAKKGEWKPGPRSDFFQAIEKELGHLPFIAEDLGDINQDVLDLRDEFHLPGMKVLQFAFGEDMPQSDYIPHNYDKHFLVYTGTHDNNTTVGWFKTEAGEGIKSRIQRYVGCEVNERNIHQVLARLAFSSVAQIAILPIQDVLGLDESARMNTPSLGENNWAWRLLPHQLDAGTEKYLLEMTKTYNRQ